MLEILVHAGRPRTLPGPHHAIRIEIPDEVVEQVGAEEVPGWDRPGSPEARSFGDTWLAEARSVALAVPALSSRPIGRVVLINPWHAAAGRIVRLQAFMVPWDE